MVKSNHDRGLETDMKSSSHRSSMSRRSRSHHRSSLNSRRRSSSLTRRSSLSRRMTRSHSSISHRKSLARRRGFDSHAFAVGRATGIRINGSHAAIHGAALHRSSSRRASFKGSSSTYRSRFSGRRMKIVNSDNKVATNVSTIGIIFVIIIGVMIIFFFVMMVIMMLNIFSIFKY